MGRGQGLTPGTGGRTLVLLQQRDGAVKIHSEPQHQHVVRAGCEGVVCSGQRAA